MPRKMKNVTRKIRIVVDPMEDKRKRASEKALESMRKVNVLFSMLAIGNLIRLSFTPGKAERAKYQMWNDIKVKDGKVIQITKDMLIVQDINRPWIKQGINKRDLLSSVGGVRIKLVS